MTMTLIVMEVSSDNLLVVTSNDDLMRVPVFEVYNFTSNQWSQVTKVSTVYTSRFKTEYSSSVDRLYVKRTIYNTNPLITRILVNPLFFI